MKYNFIEIGTSDFRTLAADETKTGISIEPVKAYFNNLPEREGLIKVNAAVSDEAGIGKMYFCKPEFIDALRLPQWLKGCNSLNKEHPSVRKYCEENGIQFRDLVSEDVCPLVTLKAIFEEHEVEELDFLKIDTEGHDAVIMKSLMKMKTIPTIHRIQFESNELTSREDLIEILKLGLDKGYSHHNVISRGNQDTILTLNH
jgi:FkbM family methyltransferase